MVSRLDSMFTALAGMGNRANAGDVTLFVQLAPVHNLAAIFIEKTI